MPRPLIHFAHANGFPSACYRAFFEALGDDIDIIMVPMLGHDPAFPVAPNWHGLAEQVADSVRRRGDGRPVIAVGHSLGGMTSFMAAHRHPGLFSGLVMMDPAYINPLAAMVMGAAKLTGQVDRLTPAGRSKGRRSVWPSRDAMRTSLRSKGLFRSFRDDCFEDYVRHGLTDCEEGVRLVYEPEREVEMFRHTPSDTWRYRRQLAIPRALISGETSEFLRGGTMHKLAAAQGIPLETTVGAHMFPFEYPNETAALVRGHILRMHAGQGA